MKTIQVKRFAKIENAVAESNIALKFEGYMDSLARKVSQIKSNYNNRLEVVECYVSPDGRLFFQCIDKVFTPGMRIMNEITGPFSALDNDQFDGCKVIDVVNDFATIEVHRLGIEKNNAGRKQFVDSEFIATNIQL